MISDCVKRKRSRCLPDLSSTSPPSSEFSWHRSFPYLSFVPVGPLITNAINPQNAVYKPAMLTSPNAPLPMTFIVLKSSKPNLVLRSLKNVDSFFPSCCSCRCLRSSEVRTSPCSRRSSSTLLLDWQSASYMTGNTHHTLYCVQLQHLPLPCSSALISIEQPWLEVPRRLRTRQWFCQNTRNLLACSVWLAEEIVCCSFVKLEAGEDSPWFKCKLLLAVQP